MNSTGQVMVNTSSFGPSYYVKTRSTGEMDKIPMEKMEKSTKPSFFRRIASSIYGYFRRSYEDSNANSIKNYPAPDPNVSNHHPTDEITGGTTFRLVSCDGGLLVITKYVTPNDFAVRTRCYVIPNSEKVGERLETIFGFESLKSA
jgi:hypothetical protein